MINAMVSETKANGIANRLGNAQPVETIYFGGGTPSLLSREDLVKLLAVSYEYFDIVPGAEVTLEANPDDVNKTSLAHWKSIGINRISLGVQSFVDEDLKWMNRVHNASQSLNSISEIQEAGFENYSVDLIFGTPTLSDENWKRNVETLINLNVPHIAAYALTVEPSTALEKMISLKKKDLVDPEKQAIQFTMIMNWLNQNGYQHYEISNYCKPGKKSKHNSSYWKGIPYVGIGPSAHSFDGKKRSWNISNNAMYISMVKNSLPFEEEVLTETQLLNEYIMISLRTMEGLDLDFVHHQFGKNYADKVNEASKPFEKRNLTTRQKNIILLTSEGKLFADGIASELFF